MDSNVKASPQKELDLYRETPIRYIGYANEVGEALRAQIGTKWVRASYAAATLYVIADTFDKTVLTYKDTRNNKDCLKKTLYTGSDTLLWQMLASVFVPGFTINRACAISNFLLKKRENIPVQARRWLVTVIGLGIIPFIIKPIDNLIDHVLDRTYRKFSPD